MGAIALQWILSRRGRAGRGFVVGDAPTQRLERTGGQPPYFMRGAVAAGGTVWSGEKRVRNGYNFPQVCVSYSFTDTSQNAFSSTPFIVTEPSSFKPLWQCGQRRYSVVGRAATPLVRLLLDLRTYWRTRFPSTTTAVILQFGASASIGLRHFATPAFALRVGQQGIL
jgi:hypothetical protein